MVNTLNVIFTQHTSVGDHVTSFDEVVHNEDTILDHDPEENVDLWNKAKEPGIGPHQGLALYLQSFITQSNGVKTMRNLSPHNGIFVLEKGNMSDHID